MYSQIFQNGHYGIEAIDCNQTTVYKNSIYDNNINGIYFGGCKEGTIQENIIYNHEGSGIFLFGCTFVDILLNTINYSILYSGISLINSNYSLLERNDVSYNSFLSFSIQIKIILYIISFS